MDFKAENKKIDEVLFSRINRLGSFIFNYEHFEKDGIIEIVDGQQRVLTINVFMSVLRDMAKEIGEKELAHKIQVEALVTEDRRGNQNPITLCGETTKEFFEKTILREDFDVSESEPQTKEEKLIKNNYLFLKEQVTKEIGKLKNSKEKKECILNLWEKIGKLDIIWIKILDENDAYEVFETVNARGVDLSVADLLKNLIFRELKFKGEKNNDFKEKWMDIEDNIKNSNIEMKKFIRHYWLSKYSFVTERMLFKTIKGKIKNYKSFLEDLSDASKDYSLLADGGIEEWMDRSYGEEIYPTILGIRSMNMTQCYSLFLCLLRNMNSFGTNPKRIFNLIESFSFVYSTIGRQPTNKLERIYSKYALKIENIMNGEKKSIKGNIERTFEELEKELKNIKPTYEQFMNNFMEISYGGDKKLKLVNYILSKINTLYETGEYKINFDKVNIEHFLPRNPRSSWGISSKEIKEYVNLLGNLTLVHERINKKAGNKSPKEKCEELKKSRIPLTLDLVKKIESNGFKWAFEEIKKRQEELGRLSFEKVWFF